MKTLALLALLAVLPASRLAAADSHININASFKVLVSSTGQRHTEAPDVATGNANVDVMIARINSILDLSHRGLRFRRQGDIQFIGGPTNAAVSAYYRAGWNDTSNLVATAQANKTTWAWTDNACNCYVTSGDLGGTGYLDINVIVMGVIHDPVPHEMGHWLGVPHPFLASDAPGGQCAWGDEGYTDTLPDTGNCVWTRDSEAWTLYGAAYANLTSSLQLAVDGVLADHYADLFFGVSQASHLDLSQRVRMPTTYDDVCQLGRDALATHNFTNAVGQRLFFDQITTNQQQQVTALQMNMMGYHSCDTGNKMLLTEQQLDVMCDHVTGIRRPTTDAKFISAGGPTRDGSQPLGSTKHPYATISQAYTAVASNPDGRDTILINPGSYAGSWTFSRPCTLRPKTTTSPDTHLQVQGSATLGR